MEVKSITIVQKSGWDVRLRLKDGREYLYSGKYPYTMAQAQVAADSARRDIARHGIQLKDWTAIK